MEVNQQQLLEKAWALRLPLKEVDSGV